MSNKPDPTDSPIAFDATLAALDGTRFVRLPEATSQQLSSRGQVAARVTIQGHAFDTVIEPDGMFGHWLRIDTSLARAAHLSPGDQVTGVLAPTKTWPEPAVPADLQKALSAAPKAIQAIWRDITPMARWEWVRWVNATNNPTTRQRRVEVSISKMESGKRRPCCFNLASCTDPQLARSGKLRDPG